MTMKTKTIGIFILIVLCLVAPKMTLASSISVKINDVVQIRRSMKPKNPSEQKKYDTYFQIKKIQGQVAVVDVYEKMVYGTLLIKQNSEVSLSDISNDGAYEISDVAITPVSPTPGFVPAEGLVTFGTGGAAPSTHTVTIPNKLQVLGDVQVGSADSSGCIQSFDGSPLAGTCVSDERLKKDIQPFETILDRLVRLTPVTYHFRSDEYPEFSFGTSKQYGLIAQQVEPLLPELVADNVKKGFKGVNYQLLPMYLLAGLKELNQRVENVRGVASTTAAEVLQGNVLRRLDVEKLTVREGAVFKGTLAVEDHVELGIDTVGQAQISAGTREVAVLFSKPYDRPPVVVAGPVDFNGAWKMGVAKIDGFTLELSATTTEDVLFNWYAFEGSKQMTISVSKNIVIPKQHISVETPSLPVSDMSISSTSPIDSPSTSTASSTVSSTPTAPSADLGQTPPTSTEPTPTPTQSDPVAEPVSSPVVEPTPPSVPEPVSAPDPAPAPAPVAPEQAVEPVPSAPVEPVPTP